MRKMVESLAGRMVNPDGSTCGLVAPGYACHLQWWTEVINRTNPKYNYSGQEWEIVTELLVVADQEISR